MTPVEIALADQLLTQGLAFWQSFQAQKAAGQLTRADLDAAALQLDADIMELEKNIRSAAAARP